jgi:hypothetical protein
MEAAREQAGVALAPVESTKMDSPSAQAPAAAPEPVSAPAAAAPTFNGWLLLGAALAGLLGLSGLLWQLRPRPAHL